MAMSETIPAGPRWRRKPGERPNQILDAALQVFSERGLEGARMEDIADLAGVSKATIYLYFPSKVEVFREMIRRAIDELARATLETRETGSPGEELQALIRAYWQEVRSPRFEAVYRLSMAEVHSFPELAREYAMGVRVPVSESAREILDRGVDDGSFAPGDNAVRVRMLLALLAKHALWCMRREFVPDLVDRSDEEVLEEVLGFFFRAVERPVGDGD
jgi:TetR/AcrR family transcriptional regulator